MTEHDTMEFIKKSLRQSFNLGQTYYQQADSEYPPNWKKADLTAQKLDELIESTCYALENLRKELEGQDSRIERIHKYLLLGLVALGVYDECEKSYIEHLDSDGFVKKEHVSLEGELMIALNLIGQHAKEIYKDKL